jgi:myo-inositol 2-dehydrogenase / D-chiro-inositol 1-dehydrogenase
VPVRHRLLHVASAEPADSVDSVPPLSIGVVGCGSVGVGIHLPILSRLPGVRVAAVADPSLESLRRARRVAAVETFPRAEELIARDDVDAVVVSAPTESHAELALAVIAAGKHLYLEKPVAASLTDAERVEGAARASAVTAAVGFNYRFHPAARCVRALLADGAIGTVQRAASRLWEPAPSWRTAAWRTRRSSGGGALLDLGSHHVDLVAWLLADEIVEARAERRSRRTEDDVVDVRLHTRAGIRCESSFSYRSGRANELVVTGEDGVVRLDLYSGSIEVVSLLARRSSRRIRLERSVRARARMFRPRLDPSYELALRAYVDTLRGRERELPTLTDGLRCLRTIAAAERSALAEG